MLVIDAAKAPGEKIRISGGGRCNFTNRGATPAQFLSANPHFCISALSRYTPADFIALVDRHRIAWHEKTLGQLFCDGSAAQIIDMLLDEMKKAGAQLRLGANGRRRRKDRARLCPDSCRRARCWNAARWWWRRAASPFPRWAPPISAIAWRGSSACAVTPTRPGAGAADLRRAIAGATGAAVGRGGAGARRAAARRSSMKRCCSPIAA